MTAENFSYYLKNPEHLYQVSYQELKSLVVQYPYCQNLRYLLLTKSQIENSEEYQKDLAIAATYHADRSHLYHLIHQEEKAENAENFVLQDDFLELKNLATNQEEQTDASQSSLILEQQEEIPTQKNEIELPNLGASSTTNIADSIIPQEAINENPDDKINDKDAAEMELAESSNSEIPTSSLPEDSIEGEVADNISDESKMISYMEKPKKDKSVIEQLLGKNKTKDKKEKGKGKGKRKIVSLSSENKINLEDELESPPSPKGNGFNDLTPVKEIPKIGKEVLFEITNKTDKEIDALMKKAHQDDENSIDKNLGYLDSKEETINEDSVKPLEASAPTPKTSFKSYLDQFHPPMGVVEDLEKEGELKKAINEALKEEKEEKEEMELMSIKKKKSKSKSKKKKLMSKIKKKKKAKMKKERKKVKTKTKTKDKKKKKTKVIAEANKSIQQSDDILSETLAELLGKQGSRKKAIQMYKRLSLIFPKKSSFFAKKIAKLKK